MNMEDNVMERKFGNFTLDELKKACEICLDTSKGCNAGCPMSGRGIGICLMDKNTSVLELIKAYEGLYEDNTGLIQHYWAIRARRDDLLKQNNEYLEQIKKLEADNLELKDKANKYEAVHGELINTQVRLRDVQNEFNAKIRALISAHEDVENLKSERKDLNIQLYDANAAKIKLAAENKELKDRLEYRKNVIDQLMKEKDETNAELLHYHVLLGSLKAIGKAIFDDQSGNHEED